MVYDKKRQVRELRRDEGQTAEGQAGEWQMDEGRMVSRPKEAGRRDEKRKMRLKKAGRMDKNRKILWSKKSD